MRRISLPRYDVGQTLKSEDLNETNRKLEQVLNELLANLPDHPHKRPRFSPVALPLIRGAAPGHSSGTKIAFQVHLLENDEVVGELSPGKELSNSKNCIVSTSSKYARLEYDPPTITPSNFEPIELILEYEARQYHQEVLVLPIQLATLNIVRLMPDHGTSSYKTLAGGAPTQLTVSPTTAHRLTLVRPHSTPLNKKFSVDLSQAPGAGPDTPSYVVLFFSKGIAIEAQVRVYDKQEEEVGGDLFTIERSADDQMQEFLLTWKGEASHMEVEGAQLLAYGHPKWPKEKQ